MNLGTLYLLPAALAESSVDVTLPAQVAAIARKLDTFAVENAKSARQTLKWLGHPLPLRSLTMLTLDEHATAQSLRACLQPLIEGKDVGLISEAGCPAIADPGANLVRHAHDSGVRVVPLVGPSSIVLALMASGLNGQCFAFHGYLPVAKAERESKLTELERKSALAGETQIFIEAPYRNQALLQSLLEVCKPQTLLCLATDLTGSAEHIATKRIAGWRQSVPNINKRPTVFLILA